LFILLNTNFKFWKKNFFDAIFNFKSMNYKNLMDYKKKVLKNFNRNESYEEIDTRLASGWYVDAVSGNKKKRFKTKEVVFRISKASE